MLSVLTLERGFPLNMMSYIPRLTSCTSPHWIANLSSCFPGTVTHPRDDYSPELVGDSNDAAKLDWGNYIRPSQHGEDGGMNQTVLRKHNDKLGAEVGRHRNVNTYILQPIAAMQCTDTSALEMSLRYGDRSEVQTLSVGDENHCTATKSHCVAHQISRIMSIQASKVRSRYDFCASMFESYDRCN
jgi:hypothetical protein